MIFPPLRPRKTISGRVGQFLLIGGMLLVLGLMLLSLWLFRGGQ